MNRPAPADDYGLIAPLTLPRDGQAPGEASGPEEYDAFFRIQHEDVSHSDWLSQVLAVTRAVADDLDSSTLSAEDRTDLLDGLTLLLQHALRLATDQ